MFDREVGSKVQTASVFHSLLQEYTIRRATKEQKLRSAKIKTNKVSAQPVYNCCVKNT